jgi:hypothetical protein
MVETQTNNTFYVSQRDSKDIIGTKLSNDGQYL